MNFAKALLVALALWIPTASFAAVVLTDAHSAASAPCEEPAPEETAEMSEIEALLPSAEAPSAASTAHTVIHESHRPLDGHIAELHLPPPNPSSPR